MEQNRPLEEDGPRVLVVDDDPAILQLITVTLTLEGVLVRCTLQPAEGLDMLDRERPDVILLDLKMPDMDGREFFHRARLLGYRGPVVICSSLDAMAARRELGAEAVLRKPFSPDELVRVVKDIAGHMEEDS